MPVAPIPPRPLKRRYMDDLPMPNAAIAAETCEKCGAGEPMIRYHADASRNNGCGWYATVSSHEPHLHFTCRTCLYEWIGKTLDFVRSAEAAESDPQP